MMIARALLMFLVFFAVIYSILQVLSIPVRRRQVLNMKSARKSALLITSCVLAALVVAFLQVADKLF
ncbi:hypothetical protein [Achromobacter sp. AGC39]